MIVLPDDELKQLLTRCWMTHDAMWFAAVMDELGMAGANRLNKDAIRRMAPIEVKRLLQVLGIEQVRSMAEVRTFLDGAFELLVGDYLDASRVWSSAGVRFQVTKCFARRGMQRLGVVEQYECGLFERIFAWLDALGLGYVVVPPISGCLVEDDRPCAVDLCISLPATT